MKKLSDLIKNIKDKDIDMTLSPSEDNILDEEEAPSIVKIFKNVPLPKIERDSPGKVYRRAMDAMEIGDMFEFKKQSRQTIGIISKGLFPKEFTTRELKNEQCGVWRTK